MVDMVSQAAMVELVRQMSDHFQRQGYAGGSSQVTSEDREESELLKKKINITKQNIKEQTKLVKEARLLEQAYKQGKKTQEEIAKVSAKVQASEWALQQAHLEHGKVVEELSDKTLPAFSTSIKNTAKSFANTFFNGKTALALFTTAVAKSANDFRSQMEFGAIATGNFTDQMYRAMKLGVDPAMLSQLSAQNRASVIAMGGVEKWSDSLVDAQKSLYGYIGDLDKTVQFTTDSFQTMRIAGITPTIEALTIAGEKGITLGDTFVSLQKKTGKTFAELNQMMRTFAENEDVRFRLASTMDDARRRGIMLEIANRQDLLVGLGMTAEQATKAGDALERMAGKGPKERFKEAAKMQAMMGMLGMGAEGAQAAAIKRKGARATSEEQNQLVDIIGRAQQKMAETRTGGLGQEFAAMSAMQLTGMDQLLGPSSPYMTALGTNHADDQAKFAEQNSVMNEVYGAQIEALRVGSIVAKDIKDNPIALTLLGLFASGGTMFKLATAQLAATTTGTAAAGAGAAGTIASLARFLGPVGIGIAVAVGLLEGLPPLLKWLQAMPFFGGGKNTGGQRVEARVQTAEEKALSQQKSMVAGWMKETGKNGELIAKQKEFMQGINQQFIARLDKGESVELQKIQETGLNNIATILREIKVAGDTQVSFADLNHQGAKRMAQIMEDGVITAEEANIIAKRDILTKIPRTEAK